MASNTNSHQLYDWPRFWGPRDGDLKLTDAGYLYDPLSERGQILNCGVVPLSDLAQVPCLALLGEPGMGKSTAVRSERHWVEEQTRARGDATLSFDLRGFQTDIRLCETVFQNPTIQSWAGGTNELHLFLDSLDECLLRIDTVVALLIEQFNELPVERLFLRIACRTAEWPVDLEETLVAIWGKEQVKILELAPLRQQDVALAAQMEGLDTHAFRSEVERREAVPLAIKPVTLKFLLNTYRRQRSFPAKQDELYRLGCRLLCEETNQGRRTARRTGKLSAEQRLAIAARIAAVTVFGNRYAIWTGIDHGDVPEADLPLHQLIGGKEKVDGQAFQVDEAAIRETLDTGLFSARGPQRMGWAHQTFAEFLAAQHVFSHELTPAQRRSLIVHSGDPGDRIVPQLRETAAWLAGMVPEVFREITRTDPEVLLRSDVATVDSHDRKSLVQAILALYDAEQAFDADFDARRDFRKLEHPGLEAQLRPYIVDPTKSIQTRRIAIEIGEECSAIRLQDDLVAIALDPQELLYVRTTAAHAVERMADGETKARLRPLAEGNAGDDPDDELKGCTLRALWPERISADELFPLLTMPKNRNLIGAYWSFLHYCLARHLQPGDLPRALLWVEQHERKGRFKVMGDDPPETIMLRGWDELREPQVCQAFARAAAVRLKDYRAIVGGNQEDSFLGELRSDNEKRHLLVRTMLSLRSELGLEADNLVFAHTPMVFAVDVPWLIEQLQHAPTVEEQKVWTRLISRVYHPGHPDLTEAVVSASQWSPPLRDSFAWLVDPVVLGSADARRLRDEHERPEKLRRQYEIRPQIEPPPVERVNTWLNEYERGSQDAWWNLNLAMTLKPDSTHYGDELQSDLTKLPGWEDANTSTRARITAAASRYLLEADPNTSQWLGTHTIHRPAFAGYRALRLLLQEVPEKLDSLPTSVWERWAPVVLAYPQMSEGDDREVQRELARRAYASAAVPTINTLLQLIDQEDQDGDSIWVVGEVDATWGCPLAGAILGKAKDEALKPSSVATLLGHLVERRIPEAEVYARSLTELPLPQGEPQRSRALRAAQVLVLHAQDAGWSTVWPAIESDSTFGRDLVELCVSSFKSEHDLFPRLTERQLADLYAWMSIQYPAPEDPETAGLHWVGTRESIAQWRDAIVKHLRDRGTPEAVTALQGLVASYPQMQWLKWMLLRAQDNTWRRTWRPPEPEVILKLAASREVRLVENGDQLLEVIVEALDRLQAKLVGVTPAIRDVWDRTAREKFRPIDENAFSDYVKRFLEEDLKGRGVIVNREVEIRRGTGAAKGERTDIHIDAVKQDPVGNAYDVITAVIEVKGCWHRELLTAMETQLAGQYLAANHYRHGLYLIGWFACDGWDPDHYQKKEVPNFTLEQARLAFTEQAAILSEQRALHIRSYVLDAGLR